MSKLHKSVVFVLLIVLAFAALLAPAMHSLSDMASTDTGTPAFSAVAYDYPQTTNSNGGVIADRYTWAG